MYIGSKVEFKYRDQNNVLHTKTVVLSEKIIREDEMSDQEVRERLGKKWQNIPIDTLRKKGVVFAVRNLLKEYPDSFDIDLREIKEESAGNSSGNKGGAIIILAIAAVIAAIICFPLLVMLGMRGKLFLKGYYDKCRGEAYKRFVRNYTFIGIGLYAVTVILFVVDKVLELYLLSGPAFALLFFGGIAYFIVSLLLVKKKYLKTGANVSFVDFLKKKSGAFVDEPESDADQGEMNNMVIADNPAVSTVDSKADEEQTAKSESKAVPVAAEVKQEKKDKKQSKNNTKKTLITVVIILVALIIVGAVIFFIGSSRGQDGKDDGANTTATTTLNNSETEETTGPAECININDYVGYWTIKESKEKELTIHSGDVDSVDFSMWYYKDCEINNLAAQLQENVASFSLAEDGEMIKGTLTFNKNSITVHITQSSMADMPSGVFEYTELNMTSCVDKADESETTEEVVETEETTVDEPIETPFVTDEETTAPVAEPYLFRTGENTYGIYNGPSYESGYVNDLPKGAYTIIEEQFDENNNRWGKLKSGVGWICVEDANGLV